MPPLPAELRAWFEAATSGGGKRERTQAQLVRAAVQVFSARGVAAASIQEIAQVAGVTAGTVYNNFATKEELVVRVALTLATSLCAAIADSSAHLPDAAQRMVVGQRRFIGLASESPQWVLVLLDAMAAAPPLMAEVEQYPLADLRLGLRQKRFKVPSETAGLDAVTGICQHGMLRVALGKAPARHDIACAALVLRALGMAAEEAMEIAKMPLPPLRMPGAAQAGTAPPPKRKTRG